MPLPHDESEILDGARAWDESQVALQGAPDPNRTHFDVDASWYGVTESEWEGAFCLVQAGDDLEELIGDTVRVTYKQREIFVYCVGAGDFPTRFALSRQAFFNLELLDKDEITVGVQPVVP